MTMQISYEPCHLPCPDMAGMANPDPQKRERSLLLLEKLREKHGIKKRVKKTANSLTYVCTEYGCLDFGRGYSR